MAGMLPGVELARRRRIHHHRGAGLDPLFSARRSTPARARAKQLRPPTTSMAMGEEALLARRRLEEKLRSFGLGSEAAQSLPGFRDGAESRAPSCRQGAAARGWPPATRTDSAPRTKKPAAAAAALERTESSGSECAVCLDRLRAGDRRRPVLNLPCAHRYHGDCVLTWLAAHPSCPCCRTPVASS